MELPKFEYFPDPVGNGCIVEKTGTCLCCGQEKPFMYVGPIYCIEDIEEVCPWCISDGRAADKWDASFNDVYNIADSVPKLIVALIDARTPGYETWQGNRWLFSETDALVFVGEVIGKDLIRQGEDDKITACREALQEWGIGSDFDLSQVVIGGQPAIYLFQDKETSKFSAYADMT